MAGLGDDWRVPDSAEQQLWSLIRASDEVIAGDDPVGDPVAFREVGEALVRKAVALQQLNRGEQAIEVWDQLVARCTLESSSRAAALTVVAMCQKAQALERAGRHDDALVAANATLERCDELPQDAAIRRQLAAALSVQARVMAAQGRTEQALETAKLIVGRADDVADQRLRISVAWALEFQSRLLLGQGRVSEALEVSAQLRGRLLDEPDGSLVRVVEIINNHSLLLLQVGQQPDFRTAGRFLVLVVLNSAAEGLGHPAVRRPLLRTLLKRSRPRGLLRRLNAGPLGAARASRERAEQASFASGAVIAKIGSVGEPDLRRGAASAQFIGDLALMLRGHPLAAIRAVEAFTNRGDQDAIQAFQWINRRSTLAPTFLGDVGAIVRSSLRARMLADGDPAIAAIAYEDDIAKRNADAAHPRLQQIFTRLLGPNR